jgi:gliding motility-associated-like protein
MTWSWEINGRPISNDTKTEFQIDSAGEHHVMLRAINSYGCSSSLPGVIPVQGNISFIPNVFTPNNDGYNNFFEIKDLEKSKWDIHVYNRWGDPVYNKKPYTNDWDGDGLAAGVYYYTLTNSLCTYRTYKGIVSIIR